MVGQSGQFGAVVKDVAGNIISKTVSWSSSNTAVVTVNSTGYATGVGVGSAQILASAGGRSGYAAVTVTGIPVATVTVTPGAATGNIGDTASFTAALADASGNALTGRTVTWSSGDTTVVVVNSTGLARAVGGGSTTLTATSEGKTGSAAVTVNGPAQPPQPTVASVTIAPGSASGAVGDSGQFTATVTDNTGAVMTNQAVTWSSDNTAVFTVTSAGVAHAMGAGSGTLTATAGGKSAAASITVSGTTPPPPATAASVSLSPASISLTTGQAQSLAANVLDASGNILSGQTITWTSSNPAVATVVGGLVTGVVAGNATITAVSGVASGSAAVTVTSTVTPPPPPPPSGSWPNAPSSYPTLSDQPWDVLNTLGWTDIWDHTGAAVVQDGTAPFSPNNVLQILYPVGWAGGSAPATQVFELGSAQHFYGGMWWKPSSPWQGHNSNVNKIQFLFLNGTGGDIYMAMYGPPGGPYEIRVSLEMSNQLAWLTPNVNNVPVQLGQWHRLEWTVDQVAGTMQFWMDGTLLGDYRNITFPSTLVEYKLSPTWGGMTDTKTENDYYWFDHILIKGY
jgi:uncharacterized protein YjdB